LKKILKDNDLDGNGVLDFNEFVSVISTFMGKSKGSSASSSAGPTIQ
jgi:Ca2+-binding EF-hand superfamily protein